MGDERANAQNVYFAYDTALAAARELYQMSGALHEKHGARVTQIDTSHLYDPWIGPKQVEFAGR